jgi:serine protease Do
MRKLHWFFTLGIGIGVGGSIVHLTYTKFILASPSPQVVKAYNPQISFAPLVEGLSPAVVNIDVSRSVKKTNTSQNEGSETQFKLGQGSGFLISPDGYLLTNYHVVEAANQLTVKLSNDEKYEGTLIGHDDSIDVALIKITSTKALPYVKMGNSNKVKVGDWAVAIGNPFGLSHTVTSGIISAKGRIIGSGPYDDFLQTDASINPGNSGGPLFNLLGEVIGINTGINPKGQGIGFSIPINKVRNILNDLKKYGHPSRGWLGIGLKTISLEQKNMLNIEKGALISQVYANSPAENGGLQYGDIILKFGKYFVDNNEDFIRVVGNSSAKKVERLLVLRNGVKMELLVTLGERPTQKALSSRTFLEDIDPLWRMWGLHVTKVQNFKQDQTGTGFIILEISKISPFTSTFKVGDIISSINGNIFESEVELSLFVEESTSELGVRFYRNGEIQHKIIEL